MKFTNWGFIRKNKRNCPGLSYQYAAIFTFTLQLVISGIYQVIFVNSPAVFVKTVSHRVRINLMLVRL